MFVKSLVEPILQPLDDGRVETGAGVKKRFMAFELDAVMLVPPSLDEWLPQNHLVRFIAEIVAEELDLARFYDSYSRHGADKSGDGGSPGRARGRIPANATPNERMARKLRPRGAGPSTRGAKRSLNRSSGKSIPAREDTCSFAGSSKPPANGSSWRFATNLLKLFKIPGNHPDPGHRRSLKDGRLSHGDPYGPATRGGQSMTGPRVLTETGEPTRLPAKPQRLRSRNVRPPNHCRPTLLGARLPLKIRQPARSYWPNSGRR